MSIVHADRRNNFNFLRLLFASLVLLSHSSELLDGNREREPLFAIFHTISFGDLAVDGFFLLSGYLIVQSWQLNPSWLRFLKKRILRIYPAFIVASLVCAFIVGPLGSDAAAYFRAFDAPTFIRSMFLLYDPITPQVFEGSPAPYVNGAMWTIKHEFRCYLMVLGLGYLGLISRFHTMLIVAAVSGVMVLITVLGLNIEILHHHFPPHNKIVKFVYFFSIGGCLYLYRDRIPLNAYFALPVALALVAAMFSPVLAELALAPLGGYLLFLFGFARISPLARFSKLPDISYGVYLYGWPAQKLVIWYLPAISVAGVFFASAIGCVTGGLLSWFLVEKWCLQLKEQPPRAKLAVDAAVK
jgi:peptidoglycan/LPS O-acetylase OafA/YrhL